MRTYIALLKGINVSGQKLIKMDDLRNSFSSLGFVNTRSYIQSGNIIFETNFQADTIENMIARKIEHDFGFQVPVLVYSVEKWKQMIDNNPFLGKSEMDISFLHISFLSKSPTNYNIESLNKKKLESEEFHITENAVYLYCPHGYGKTKLNNGFWETQLRVIATTRNWKTATEILRIAQE